MLLTHDTDVLLIGGGIMSATLAALLREHRPETEVTIVERLPKVALEASAAHHNAGTGHAGLCELNYTPANGAGEIDTSKAVAMNSQFRRSLATWTRWSKDGVLGPLSEFLTPVPHMSFVSGEANIEFLRARHAALSKLDGFEPMEFSTDPDAISRWAPLLTENRSPEPIAATWHPGGYDVDFGVLTRQLLASATRSGAQLKTNTEVTRLTAEGATTWRAEVRSSDGSSSHIRAKRVFVGAGGWALKLLQTAQIEDIRGYGLLPVSGKFLHTTDPSIIDRHDAKVYGKAPVGAPPMSMPHLDARVIDGERSVLFGPFAGTSPRFLLHGRPWDMPGIMRAHNIPALATMAANNLPLITLLAGEVFTGRKKAQAELRAFGPNLEIDKWHMRKAGQRAQIVKPDRRGHGVLQFGTEVIRSRDGSLAALLGASPGASTALPIMEDLLASGF